MRKTILLALTKLTFEEEKRSGREEFSFSFYLVLPLEGAVLEADIVVVKRRCDKRKIIDMLRS